MTPKNKRPLPTATPLVPDDAAPFWSAHHPLPVPRQRLLLWLYKRNGLRGILLPLHTYINDSEEKIAHLTQSSTGFREYWCYSFYVNRYREALS